jgi:hypothetical protein
MLSYNYCSITFQQFFQYKPFNNTRNGAKLKTHNKHPRINSFTTFLKKQLNQKDLFIQNILNTNIKCLILTACPKG